MELEIGEMGRDRLKAGWVGTLDPMASGVVPLALGGATSAISSLPRGWKRYRATVLLGASTSSDDVDCDSFSTLESRSTGFLRADDVYFEEFLPRTRVAKAGELSVHQAAAQLTGLIEQYPPHVSSVKVGGRRAHELARRGALASGALLPRQQLVREVRVVQEPSPVSEQTLLHAHESLSELRAIGWTGGPIPNGLSRKDERWVRHRALAAMLEQGHLHNCQEVVIEVECDAGTYIRSLAKDLAAMMGHLGCLSSLTRLESHGLSVESADPLQPVPDHQDSAGAGDDFRGTGSRRALTLPVLSASDVAVTAGAPSLVFDAAAWSDVASDCAVRVAEQAAWVLLGLERSAVMAQRRAVASDAASGASSRTASPATVTQREVVDLAVVLEHPESGSSRALGRLSVPYKDMRAALGGASGAVDLLIGCRTHYARASLTSSDGGSADNDAGVESPVRRAAQIGSDILALSGATPRVSVSDEEVSRAVRAPRRVARRGQRSRRQAE
jgi:tRNA U55 pseudouridine synthase TruB